MPDIINSLWGAGRLALVIAVAVMGGPSGVETTLNISHLSRPPALPLPAPFEIWGELVIFTAGGLIVTVVLTYPTIAALQLAATFGAKLDAANARLLGSAETLPQPALAA